jgi:hypothetical protein
MQEHPTPNPNDDQTRLVGLPGATSAALATIGLLALAAGLALGWSRHDQWRGFSASYLVHYMFFLSISLGSLFFVALQHVVRAGWSVVVRRLAEILAANMFYLAILFLPILVPLLLGMTGPYFKWLDPDSVANNELLQGKSLYLNLPFFTARAVFYFLIWGLLARFFLGHSTRQDTSGDPKLTQSMERIAPLALVLFGLTVTFASFDWLMSIEPAWFSTIFGLYYFAGSVVGALAALILFAIALQKAGMVSRTITTEHYHDLGKLLLGFIVFWGYMAFSQYMLIWYANIPEESVWYLARQTGPWTWITLGLLFGHLLIPFLCLLPREVKRRKILLGMWAVWMLVVHWIDLYWLVMPTFSPERLPFGPMDLCCITAIACLFLAGTIHTARACNLIPIKDPRLAESLAFENV